MNGLPYYKAYPRDFLEGTVGMPFDLKGAYRLVLDLIYMQNGRLPDDARYIAGLLGCTVRAWNGYRERLISMGKLQAENGIISNFRANFELDNLREISRKNSESARLPRKNKRLGEANAERTLSHTDTDKERDTLEGKPSNDAGASSDPAKVMFDSGVALLTAAGVNRHNARAMVGKWRKDHGTEAVIAAIGRAQREGAIDPVAFIVGALRFAAKAAEPKPGDSRVLSDGRKQVFQAGNGWMTEHA